jgi:hypothetical protein
MKQRKPQNSVTRRTDALMSGIDFTDRLPVLESAKVSVLESLFPPRTKGRSETEDEHLRYAGMVELVERLRARSDNHYASLAGDDVGDDDEDLTEAEHA